MSGQDGFHVLANAPGRDVLELERVRGRLSETFAVEIQQEALQSGGVLVHRATSIDEAQSAAERVKQLGADAVIVDPAGKVVEVKEVELSFLADGPEQGASPAPPPPSQDATLMGGWGQQQEDNLVAIGFAETMMGAGRQVPTDPAGPAAGAPDPRAAGPAGTSGMAQGMGQRLDSLDVDSLVMLDGSEDESAALALDTPVSAEAEAGDFAPPVEDEVLELDDSAPSHALGVSAVDPESFTAPPPPPAETQPEATGMSFVAAGEEAEEPAASPLPGPRASGSMPGVSRTAVRSALRQKWSPLHALSDLFRQWPRLRIVIGFVLALGLGSIAPTCYSQSVSGKSFHPLLVDLSTAKAHGHLLQGQPDYRSPEEIQEQIASLQTRYGIHSFLLWLMIGGGVGFAWFRLTRP